MFLRETILSGVLILEQDRIEDHRGYFSRIYCTNQLNKFGIDFQVDQISTSYNAKKDTLRGMHYQEEPNSEFKIVRCTRGKIYDVVADLRPESETYLKWLAIELSEANGMSVLIPSRCAHGFQTLEDSCEVLYTNYGIYSEADSRTVRWDDSAINIHWPPCAKRIMSEKDKNQPDLFS